MHETPRFAFERDGSLSIAAPEGPLVLRWRRSERAGRLCLRNGAKGLELVVPRWASLAEAGRFAFTHAGWIARQLDRYPPPTVVAAGLEVPFLGERLVVVHRTDAGARGPAGERVAWVETGALHVRGEAAHLPRRVEDFLREQARLRLGALAREKGAALGRQPARITVRDAATRWGSCSVSGAISFCWRLVMAPPPVMDYVAAHEVAHLAHMNHGPRFWRTCARLLADGDGDGQRRIERARAWLRHHGPALHAVRFRA
jgi:predicted metal-dependent hydrolase